MVGARTGGIAAALGALTLLAGELVYYATVKALPSVVVTVFQDALGNAFVIDLQGNLIVNANLVTDYGASHGAGVSGAATTTKGIKEAILFLPNNSGTVLLADAVYPVNQLILDFISDSAALTLQGNTRDGVIIRQLPNSNSTVFFGFSNPARTKNSLTLRNLTFDWNSTQNRFLATQSITLNLADVKYADVNNLVVQNGDLGLDAGYNITPDPMIHNVQNVISRNNRVGFWLTLNQPDPFLYSGTFTDCTAESGQVGSGAGPSGFYIEEANGLHLIRPKVIGANFPLNSVGIFVQRARNTTIDDPGITGTDVGLRIGGVISTPPPTQYLYVNNPLISGSRTAGLLAYGGPNILPPIVVKGGAIDIISDLTMGVLTFR